MANALGEPLPLSADAFSLDEQQGYGYGLGYQGDPDFSDEPINYSLFSIPSGWWSQARPAEFPEGSWEDAELNGGNPLANPLHAIMVGIRDPEALTGLEYRSAADGVATGTGELEGTPTIEDEVYA